MSQLVVRKNGKNLPSLFSSFFNTDRFPDVDFFDWGPKWLPEEWKVAKIPSVNIMENDKDYLLEMAVPGMEKKDLKVEVGNNMLTISAEKEEKKEEKEDGFSRKEFSYNSFCRSFTLPENTDGDKVDAEYKDGILKIAIPKKEVKVIKTEKAIAIK
jgi:HSP20 family protein